MELITEHLDSLTVLVGLIIPTLLQVAPIKINPWSWIATVIGRAINKEILEKVDYMQYTIDRHITEDAERDIKQCRLRILRFNDEIILGKKHSREHFNEILDDITAYKNYCKTHPNYENNKAVLAIENVKRVYRQCEIDNSFL